MVDDHVLEVTGLPDEPGRIVLSNHDWDAFMAALENPPKPNAALKGLMKEFGPWKDATPDTPARTSPGGAIPNPKP
jgi:hypothetical protein